MAVSLCNLRMATSPIPAPSGLTTASELLSDPTGPGTTNLKYSLCPSTVARLGWLQR
jgi:hypothetical protein